MRDAIIDFARGLPAPLAIVVLAMVPIFELRGAIPIGHWLGEGVVPAYVWAVIGNLIPVPFILFLLGPVTEWAERHWRGLHRFLEKLFSYTRRRHDERFERFRDLALITFVAIPLPVTGAWSGSLAAYVFGVRPRKAFVLIAAGVAVAGVIVTILTEAFGLFVFQG